MPLPRKSQKEIAQQYAGNRRYFKDLHGLRRTRIVLAVGCLLAALAVAFIYLKGSRSSQRFEKFNSPGGISEAHSGKDMNCASCHDAAIKPDPARPAVVNASLDAKCEVCHTRHTFHQPDVALDRSCVDCHHEHLGTGPMQMVKDQNCITCHGDAGVMAASLQKGLHLPAGDFQVKPKDVTLVAFPSSRPAGGYTRVFQSFEDGHPDFQIQREHSTDPNTLKFDHKVHLTGDIPEVDGHKLDCAYCHQPDSHGAYMQPISFAKNCQSCHALQIDPTLADFQIPHPSGGSQASSVRDFILTLPTQYASYASGKKGLTNPAQVAAFVNEHMTAIRQRVREGADLEKEVFYSDARSVRLGAGTDRALFPGCAYCHEVKTSAGQEPVITKPVTPDRWYVRARFNHAAHGTMNCADCHGQVLQSAKTSDINLPDKASCVTCHSAEGGVVSTCATCHDYHNQAPASGVAEASSAGK